MYKKNSALQIEYDKMRYQKIKKNQVNITKNGTKKRWKGVAGFRISCNN